MRWLRDICSSHKHLKQAWKISKLDVSCYHAVNNFWDGNSVEGLANSRCLASHVGYLSSIQLKSSAWRSGSHLPYDGSLLSRYHIPLVISRKFWHAKEEPTLSRDWLVSLWLASLWLADKEMESYRRKRKQRLAKHVKTSNTTFQSQASSNVPLARWFSGTYHPEGISIEDRKPSLTQPPLSQSATGILKPSSPEELKVAPLLARSNLLITRNIEWANLMLGFEQENRYAILDPCYPQAPVGFIMEQSNVIARQLLRTRRPFVAYITDGMGNELFRVRRPFWWITSTIFAEIDGKEIGVVHRRWHLWRRVYDLYLGNRQFAVVENPGFWYWTFTLKDADGNVLAEIDRNWRGVGFELFTDAGQYVIRFGDADQKLKTGASEMIQELEVARPLTLSERAVALALAVSLDNDYFSRHGGWGLPFVAIGE